MVNVVILDLDCIVDSRVCLSTKNQHKFSPFEPWGERLIPAKSTQAPSVYMHLSGGDLPTLLLITNENAYTMRLHTRPSWEGKMYKDESLSYGLVIIIIHDPSPQVEYGEWHSLHNGRKGVPNIENIELFLRQRDNLYAYVFVRVCTYVYVHSTC